MVLDMSFFQTAKLVILIDDGKCSLFYLCSMGSVFRFKQFEVDQSACAMKINTDGVLLGATERDIRPARILDIGTGTGVVALMLAQAFPEAVVDAVEIDETAAKRAQMNFADSNFASRLQLFHTAFQGFCPQEKYDLIISNPPFYMNSLHAPDERKKLAKHTDTLFFEDLLHYVRTYLTSKGIFECIVPPALANWLIDRADADYALHLQRIIDISSFENGEVIRRIVSLGKEEVPQRHESLYIYAEKGIHSVKYKQLLAPYFLAY